MIERSRQACLSAIFRSFCKARRRRARCRRAARPDEISERIYVGRSCGEILSEGCQARRNLGEDQRASPQLLAANALILNDFIVSRCKLYCTGNLLNSLGHSHLPARPIPHNSSHCSRRSINQHLWEHFGPFLLLKVHPLAPSATPLSLGLASARQQRP